MASVLLSQCLFLLVLFVGHLAADRSVAPGDVTLPVRTRQHLTPSPDMRRSVYECCPACHQLQVRVPAAGFRNWWKEGQLEAEGQRLNLQLEAKD